MVYRPVTVDASFPIYDEYRPQPDSILGMHPAPSFCTQIDRGVSQSELPYGYEAPSQPYYQPNAEGVDAWRAQVSHYRPYKKVK